MNNALHIKVCGMREQANILALAQLQPDYMGFIFYKKSNRYFLASETPADLSLLPKTIQKVGVFVDENPEIILELAKKHNLDILQLHGQESPQICAKLKSHGFRIWKALSIEDHIPQEIIAAYSGSVNCFLLDTKTPAHGGSGLQFDWSILKTYTSSIPFMLAGGIGPDNFEEAKKYLKGLPALGLDLNSKFETEPGLKNIESLTKAFETIQK